MLLDEVADSLGPMDNLSQVFVNSGSVDAKAAGERDRPTDRIPAAVAMPSIFFHLSPIG